MKRRWLLLSLLPIALLLLAVGALAFQSSDGAEAGAISGDPVACAADNGALATSVVDGVSLASTEDALLAARCYMVGITIFDGGCGSDDLYVLRYLCYEPGRGWYYTNYWYCQ
jgi:hypothetical protein